MGKGHIAVNKYMSDKVRFADLINGKIFGGEQVVLPEELEKVEGESEILLEDVVFQIIYAPILHFIYNHFQDYLECHITLFKPNYAR